MLRLGLWPRRPAVFRDERGCRCALSGATKAEPRRRRGRAVFCLALVIVNAAVSTATSPRRQPATGGSASYRWQCSGKPATSGIACAPQVQMNVVHVTVQGKTWELPIELQALSEQSLAPPDSLGSRCGGGCALAELRCPLRALSWFGRDAILVRFRLPPLWPALFGGIANRQEPERKPCAMRDMPSIQAEIPLVALRRPNFKCDVRLDAYAGAIASALAI